MSEAGAPGGAPRSLPSPHALPRARRLRRHNDFLRTERVGTRAHGAFVTLVARPGRGRLGFTVSKKVSPKATTRNLVKRRLREVLRTAPDAWAALDLVVIARPEAVGRTLAELKEDVARAIKALGVALARAPAERRVLKGGAHGEKTRAPRR